jgi:hypothetical protein
MYVCVNVHENENVYVHTIAPTLYSTHTTHYPHYTCIHNTRTRTHVLVVGSKRLAVLGERAFAQGSGVKGDLSAAVRVDGGGVAGLRGCVV